MASAGTSRAANAPRRWRSVSAAPPAARSYKGSPRKHAARSRRPKTANTPARPGVKIRRPRVSRLLRAARATAQASASSAPPTATNSGSHQPLPSFGERPGLRAHEAFDLVLGPIHCGVEGLLLLRHLGDHL